MSSVGHYKSLKASFLYLHSFLRPQGPVGKWSKSCLFSFHFRYTKVSEESWVYIHGHLSEQAMRNAEPRSWAESTKQVEPGPMTVTDH